jgi:8-oxo-dGTP diphosphatase
VNSYYSAMKNEIIETFGNKLRVRICGICIDGESMLMIKHHALGPKNIFWSPPGGGLQFGESAEEALKREFIEETGLNVEIKKFLFVHEFLDEPLHAIEIFFEVKKISGNLITGKDTELKEGKQIIQDVKFMRYEDIQKMDPDILHNIFRLVNHPREILGLTGYKLYKPV